MALTGGFSGEPDDDGNSLTPAKAESANHVKSLQYSQQAKKAIAEATDKAAAQKHLDTVRLRVKEKSVAPEVYRDCEAEFKRVWEV
jgi:hypothetical protein